jgi:hypothetical protein
LFTTLPDGTEFYKFNGVSYDISTCFGGVWDPAGVTLNPGEGGFIRAYDQGFTITFVGEVMQSATHDLSVALNAGYTAVGSKVPQTADVNALGLTASMKDGDEIYIFNGVSYDIYTVFGGEWDPSIPVIEVAHSVYVNLYGGAATWNRTFNINNN